jgi:hypothetical protein
MAAREPVCCREWKPWEDFRLVSGYLPEIDQLPETALRLGLLRRVAAVLNDGDVPRSRLYWDLVEAFVDSLGAESVTFEIDTDRATLPFTSISLLRQYVDGRSDIGVPFSRATLYSRGRVQAFIDTEFWATCGGPFPYHDSWTFAIYRDTDELTQIRDACYRACMRHGIPICEEIRGVMAPVAIPRWKRVLRWLLR